LNAESAVAEAGVIRRSSINSAQDGPTHAVIPVTSVDQLLIMNGASWVNEMDV